MLDEEPTLLNKEGIPFKFVEKEKNIVQDEKEIEEELEGLVINKKKKIDKMKDDYITKKNKKG